MKNPHLRAPALVLALLLMLTLAACGGDDTETMAPVEPDKLPGQEETQEEGDVYKRQHQRRDEEKLY